MNRALPSYPAMTRRRAEFERLLGEYSTSCRPGSDERARLDGWPALRSRAQQRWKQMMESYRSGQDVSEAALWQLLPYKVTPLANSRGAFCHPAAAFRDDPRARFAGTGWIEEDDWPRLGHGLFEFVLRCDDYPPDLWQACEAFAALPGGRAFTSGMLSPILNALRPDDFVLVNAAGRAVLNHFEGCTLAASLSDYPTANKAARTLIGSLEARLTAAPFEGIHPADVFEGFCHWLVHTRMHPLDDAGGDDPRRAPEVADVFPTSLLGMRPLKSELPPEPPEADASDTPAQAQASAPAPDALDAPSASGASVMDPAARAEDAPRSAAGTPEADAAPEAVEAEDDIDLVEPAPPEDGGAMQPDPHAAEESLLARCLAALDRKGQIVLYGPPGSGKGRLARRLAARLVEGSDGLRGHVAFHARWTYEDFIQQQLPDGQRRLGRFTAFCRKAAGRRGCSVMVIEDLQRARVAEVLGEALVLLGQRGSEVTLAGGGSLVIPPRVRLIATVDSSQDRGVLSDPVLRQRFAFVPVEPLTDAAG